MIRIIDNEIIRFLIAGTATLIIDYGVLLALTDFCHVYYILSATISFVLAVVANYYICLTWVFKNSKKQSRKQFAFFVATSIIGLLLNIGIMKIAVDFMKIHYVMAKIVSTVLVTAWNYVTKKRSIEMKII